MQALRLAEALAAAARAAMAEALAAMVLVMRTQRTRAEAEPQGILAMEATLLRQTYTKVALGVVLEFWVKVQTVLVVAQVLARAVPDQAAGEAVEPHLTAAETTETVSPALAAVQTFMAVALEAALVAE